MIVVNLKPFRHRQNQVAREKVIYYVSGMVNWNVPSRPNTFRPPTDALETDDKLIIRVEIAGISGDNFSINFDQQVLSIQGIRQDSLPKRAFHQMEIQYGEFSTDIEINIPIDSDHISAEYCDGFLIIEMPKHNPSSISVDDDH